MTKFTTIICRVITACMALFVLYADTTASACEQSPLLQAAVKALAYNYWQPNSPKLSAARASMNQCFGSQSDMISAIEAAYASLGRHNWFGTENRLASLHNQEISLGLRVKVELENGTAGYYYVVTQVGSGSDAQQEGIRVGDSITSINNEMLRANLPEGLLWAKPNEIVTLQVSQGGQSKTYTVRANPTNMPVSYVLTFPNLPYVRLIRLFGFPDPSSAAANAVADALQKAPNPGVIILDLRNNPGGLVDSANLVASVLIPQGQLETQHLREGGQIVDHVIYLTPEGIFDRVGANKPTFTDRYPYMLKSGQILIVWVDHYSASAAEMLTGALEANEYVGSQRRIFVVGESTYGKGTIQTVVPVGQGYYAGVTWGTYTTPRGEWPGDPDWTQRRGLAPDYRLIAPAFYSVDSYQDPFLVMTLEVIKANAPWLAPNTVASR